MARSADVAEIIRHVVWIGCSGKVCLMAGITGGRGVRIAGTVARDTRGANVSSCQRENGRAVVEGRRYPGGRVVTRGAGLTEVIGHVIGTGCALIISLVAGVARRRSIVVSRSMADDASLRGVSTG